MEVRVEVRGIEPTTEGIKVPSSLLGQTYWDRPINVAVVVLAHIILNIPPLFRPSVGSATSCFSISIRLPFSALLPPASQSAFFPRSMRSLLFVGSHVWH